MAIVLDSSASGGLGQFNHACSSASVLFVYAWDSGGGISGIKSGGTPLTFLLSDNNQVSPGVLYALVNPPDGSNTISATGSLSNNGAISISYKNDDHGILDSSAVNNITGQTLSVSTTVVASNCWFVAFGSAFGAQFNLTTSNRTTRQSIFIPNTSGQGAIIACDSNGSVTPGSQGVTFTNNGSSPFQGGIALSIRPGTSSNALFFAGD